MARSNRLRWRKVSLIAIAMVLSDPAVGRAVAQEVTQGAEADGGIIVTRVLGEAAGEVEHELAVLTPDGEELRRIDVPRPERVVTTMRAGTVLVEVGEGLGTPEPGGGAGEVFLVDAAAGEAQRLELLDDLVGSLTVSPPSVFPNTVGSERWAVLGDAQQSAALLVDLASGKVKDLVEIVGESGRSFVASVQIAPDDAHLLVWLASGLWLVPTDEPADARQLAEEGYAPSFDADGGRVIFSRQGENDTTDVIIASVERETEEVIATAVGQSLAGVFAGDGQRVALYAEDRVDVIDIGSGRVREVTTFAAERRDVVPASGGERVLLGLEAEGAEERSWRWLDLVAGRARDLDELAGFEVVVGAKAGDRYAVLATGFPFDVQAEGEAFRVADLRTGEVGDVLRAFPEGKAGAYYDLPTEVTGGGRYRLIPVGLESGGRMELWLLNAEEDEVRPIGPEATRVSGAFSPDGERVVVSVLEWTTDGEVTTAITVYAVDGGEGVEIGGGFGAVSIEA